MPRETIEIQNEEQWLDLRKQDITSTKMAALLDLSPYSTPFEVYHAFKSGVQVPFDPTERMEKGRRMEAYIAQEVALEKGWEVRPLNIYMRDPSINMGASFDFEYTKPDGTVGIMEIKGVDYFQFKEKWEDPAEDGEATDYVEIQLQHQLEVADKYEEAVIVAATSIYDFHIYERKRDREFGDALRSTIIKFWQDVNSGNEPSANFYRDAEVIGELYPYAKEGESDYTANAELNALLSKYQRLANEEKEAKSEKGATKAEIFSILKNDGLAFTGDFKVTATFTKDSVGTFITEDMVGTTIGARKGYRQCRIKDLRK